jgi:hypothetical protein
MLPGSVCVARLRPGWSGRSASWSQVLGEPVAGWAARGFEAFYVGVEMTVGQDHELLGLVRLVVGSDGEFGRDEVVARCHQQQQRCWADIGQVAHLWVPKTSSMSCDLRVFIDDAAKAIAPVDVAMI